jgi:beta-1,4-mannosyl-glycoprotein beta-1,4-N-acetylglucosaminyltransferase
MKVYDLFTYNGEEDLLEIRFNILSPFVDRFVLCESTETFSGLPKPLYWKERGDRFKHWEDKVEYVVPEYGTDEAIMKLMAARPYVGQEPFKRAFYQKENLKTALIGCDDEDVIYYGDVDEIWKPQEVDDKVHKLRQLAYSYYLNNRSPEDWRGTIVTKYKNLRNGCLNDMRANPVEADIWEDGGYHFTNLGGVQAVLRKIESYDHQEVNIPWVKDGMSDRLEQNVDFLGRGFQFWVDESQLPQYLIDNKERWQHLWKD